MPLNYSKVFREIQNFASGAARLKREREKQQEKALELLHGWGEKAEDLRYRVAVAAEIANYLHIAAPTEEPINAAIPPPPTENCAERVLFLAADGSQIEPNPHGALFYALVNVGVVVMAGHETPRTLIESRFYDPETLLENRPDIPLQRDLAERQALAKAVAAWQGAPKAEQEWRDLMDGLPQPEAVVTLTDGPLELWGAKDATGGFAEALKEYLKSLHSLLAAHRQAPPAVLTAGYVDKPHADPVVQLLRLAAIGETATPEQIKAELERRPPRFAAISDAALFRRLLAPGERSAIFRLVSRSREDYTGNLALHFFYLNASPTTGRAAIARVEIPAWVAKDPKAVQTLHAALLWQTRHVPNAPYPYILHRAHEEAVVRRGDRETVERWLTGALAENNVPLGSRSAKQILKDLTANH